MKSVSHTNVAIIGAGPAGLSAAIHAAQEGRGSVTVFESNSVAGRKLLITGGGRCNLTHDLEPKVMQAAFEPKGRFLSFAMHAHPPKAVMGFFEQRGLGMRIEPDGCVFPQTDRASDVRDIMVKEAKWWGAEYQYNQTVMDLLKEGTRFLIRLRHGTVTADQVILATGGKSYPKTGCTGDGYTFARGLGHTVVPAKPSLVPLVVAETWPRDLAGTALSDVTLSSNHGGAMVQAVGNLMFTQTGIGGPVAQDISRFLTADLPNRANPIPVWLDCLSHIPIQQLDRQIRDLCQANPNKTVVNLVGTLVPRRLAAVVCALCHCEDTLQAGQLARPRRQALADALKAVKLSVTNTRGMEEATVTHGGIATDQIDPKTMGSTLCPGLYFAGEVIDVDGPCGGYHLQMCWSTGAVAGRAAAMAKL